MSTVAAPPWPVRVITVASASPAVRWDSAEFRHHGIALHSDVDAIDSLLELGKEPGSVLLVPTDMTGLPLLEFVELATSVIRAVVIIGRAVGTDEAATDACLGLGARGVVDLPITPERLAEAIAGIRSAEHREPEILRCGALVLDRGQHRVHVDGREVRLALREFELLEQLMRAYPRVATSGELTLGLGKGATTAAHIPVAIRRLRVRLALADASQTRLIETVRGVGYRIIA